VILPDGQSLTLGDGGDVKLKHQSGHFEINNVTGNTYFQANGQIRLRGNDSGTEEMIIATAGGAVELYYDNVKKFETHANGVHMSGSIYLPDSQIVGWGDVSNPDLRIYHDGTYNRFRGANYVFMNAAGNEYILEGYENGAVKLYFDNSKKFETYADGAKTDGDHFFVGTNGNAVWQKSSDKFFHGDNVKDAYGNSDDLQIYHDGTNSHIDNNTGELRLDSPSAVKISHNSNLIWYTESDRMRLNDSVSIDFGNASDLRIYHDGSDNYIYSNNKNLYLNANGSTISINPVNAENSGKFFANGAVELYYDNSKKFETTSTGAKITKHLEIAADDGGLDLTAIASNSNAYLDIDAAANRRAAIRFSAAGTAKWTLGRGDSDELSENTFYIATGNSGGTDHKFTLTNTGDATFAGDLDLADSKKLKLGAGDDLQIYHDGNNSIIGNSTGVLIIASPSELLLRSDTGETMVRGVPNGASELYYDSSKKIETTSSGVTVTGSVTTQDINMSNLNSSANEVDNTKGSWTLQEGANDLFLINRVNGKKYKFNITEI
jgi:hypothetical protein